MIGMEWTAAEKLEFKEHLVPVAPKEVQPKWKANLGAKAQDEAKQQQPEQGRNKPMGVATYGMKGGRPTSAGGWRGSA